MTAISDSERRILEAAARLTRIMEKASAKIREAAFVVHGALQGNDPSTLEELLEVRTGISRDDVRLLGSIATAVTEHGTALGKVIPLTYLRYLAQCDAAVRTDVIAAVASGVVLRESDLTRIESHRKWSQNGNERLEADARAACFESFSREKTAEDLRLLDKSAEALIEEMRLLISKYVDHDAKGDPKVNHNSRSYQAAFESIRTNAAAIIQDFERILGTPGSITTDARTAEASLLGDAYAALERLASGQFAHAGGFAFDGGVRSLVSSELIDAISYLCAPIVETQNQYVVCHPQERLRVLELAAGAGGQAIGLMAAGFDHAALYEIVRKRVKTLKSNWPKWKVRKADLRRVPDAEFARFHGIDLLAGSIAPGEATRQDKAASGRKHLKKQGNLSLEMVRAITIVEPRAFMLESGKSLADKEHATHLMRLRDTLKEKGYTVTISRVNGRTFGLPQDFERTVLVGIRNNEPGAFIHSMPRAITEKSILQALGELVIRYETPEESRHLVEDKTPQKQYDRWAAHWREYKASTWFSSIPSATDKRPDYKSGLYAEGFDGSELASEATKITEPGTDFHFRPKLTLQILAKAQGFPEGWNFNGMPSGIMKMIAEALPPVIAKAIGLQIHSALTGVDYDLDAALKRPLINESAIGRYPIRLNGNGLPPDVGTKVMMIMRDGDYVALAPGSKNRKKVLRRLVKSVEPNHMRWSMITSAVEREQADNDWEDQHFHEEERRLFPHGVP